MTDALLHWTTDQLRSDGMQVIEANATGTLGTSWIVVPPRGVNPSPDASTPGGRDGRPEIRLCPCCDRPMLTAGAAQLVADFVYPLPGKARP